MGIKRLQKRLDDKEITIDVTDAALDYLTDIGFDPVYGARPLKRTIQRELETVVARGILDGQYGDGDSIAVDYIGNKLEVYNTFDGGYSNPSTDGYGATGDGYGNQSPADYAGYTENFTETSPFN